MNAETALICIVAFDCATNLITVFNNIYINKTRDDAIKNQIRNNIRQVVTEYLVENIRFNKQ